MYVVVAQENTRDRFIQEVYGPFETHTEAAIYADKLEKAPGNSYAGSIRKYICHVILMEKP